ncbi:hypothetical protein D5S18_08240 [Nocardia panacis]|uniref:DUF3558 domain-containing protein n=1 Tax=Nocardia panacis TaxID=2340916 RepID=A0A3A4K5Q1_9NOCA|nr:hypothetical protein [Nocardia panacis]RJO76329.1 hypothetical protein D5S18_08240 [Nocardia panacis]
MRRLLTAALLACLLASSGCAAGKSDPARFEGMAKSCVALTYPVEAAVREFAGKLYSAEVSFEDVGARYAAVGTDAAGTTCFASYPGRAQPYQPIEIGEPRRRKLSLTFKMLLGPDPVAAVRRYFEVSREHDGGTQEAGIGEQSYSATRVTNELGEVVTAFRISNFFVAVSALGDNNGSRGGANYKSPVLFQNLKSGSELVAKALATHVDAVVAGR